MPLPPKCFFCWFLKNNKKAIKFAIIYYFIFCRINSSWWIGHEIIASFGRSTNSPRPESHLRMAEKCCTSLAFSQALSSGRTFFIWFWDHLGRIGTYGDLLEPLETTKDEVIKKDKGAFNNYVDQIDAYHKI